MHSSKLVKTKEYYSTLNLQTTEPRCPSGLGVLAPAILLL